MKKQLEVQNVAQDDFQVVELDREALEAVTGHLSDDVSPVDGASNGNCGCAAGSTYSGTPTNGNCGCGGLT